MSIKIKPSKRNTNKHTEKGMSLLEHSIDTIGVIESISVTDEGTIISGHARKELFDKKGMIPKEIKLADNEYPVIVTDIKDDTKEYYQAQILANTTAHHNYNLDTTEIEVIAMEYDLEVEELGVEIEEVAMEPDYSLLDENDSELTKQANEMSKGVKKAIQIEFESEHYEEAYELVKYWRERDAYVGGMIMEYLKAEKEKV